MFRTNRHKYILVFVLLAFSGNPLVTHALGKYAPAVGLLLVLTLTFSKKTINKSFNKTLLWIVGGIAVICFFQYLEFKFVAIEGIANLCAKIIFGGFVINYLREEFAKIYFDVLSFLCVLSLGFFLVITVFNIPLPHLTVGGQFHSFLLYTVPGNIETTQNAGMFWEPGAFAGIITLGLLLNFNRFGLLLKYERNKVIVVVLALLTTQSTTGYLVGFMITIAYLLISKNFLIAIAVIPVVLSLGFVIYSNTDFLKSKIEYQFEKSADQSIGEFSNTRFGSLIFDWHYIKKHPLFGNGLNKKTRYADHQFLFSDQEEDTVRSGNGFSHYLASMGLFFIGGYFFFLWKSTRIKGKRYAFLFLLIVFLNLQGEQWLNFPLYLGLPFLIMTGENRETRYAKKNPFLIKSLSA